MIDLAADRAIGVNIVSGRDVWQRQRAWASRMATWPPSPVGADPRWLLALADGLGHVPYCLEARRDGELVGLLPLSLVRGPLFGRFLVSLPYVSTCGPLAIDRAVAASLVQRAVTLADELRVKHLELRVETTLGDACFAPSAMHKVLMRRPLPSTAEALWKALDAKVRNQIRKGEKHAFTVTWGGQELLAAFYQIFSRNMRDLGTPVFGQKFFASILHHFPAAAEVCVVSLRNQHVAAALLVHGRGITEVPSASALRHFHPTNVNMFLYWQLLQRAISRGQRIFDFGRSTRGCGTERFKAQWGAAPEPAAWECYNRHRKPSNLRKESSGFALLTQAWRYLPVRVAEFIGPAIVRGIP
jgi:FemAB-related protein (PEP-CTERM system-associated)